MLVEVCQRFSDLWSFATVPRFWGTVRTIVLKTTAGADPAAAVVAAPADQRGAALGGLPVQGEPGRADGAQGRDPLQ